MIDPLALAYSGKIDWGAWIGWLRPRSKQRASVCPLLALCVIRLMLLSGQ